MKKCAMMFALGALMGAAVVETTMCMTDPAMMRQATRCGRKIVRKMRSLGTKML